MLEERNKQKKSGLELVLVWIFFIRFDEKNYETRNRFWPVENKIRKQMHGQDIRMQEIIGNMPETERDSLWLSTRMSPSIGDSLVSSRDSFFTQPIILYKKTLKSS